jgi:hypothetical protein
MTNHLTLAPVKRVGGGAGGGGWHAARGVRKPTISAKGV